MPANPVTEFTPEKKATFLEALEEWPNVTAAAKKAGVSRRTIYNHRNKDAEFGKQFDDSRDLGIDALEDDTLEAAKKSDTLRIFLLKGNRPDKYADRKQITGANGGPFAFNLVVTPTDGKDGI